MANIVPRTLGLGVAISLLVLGAPPVGVAQAATLTCGQTITGSVTLTADVGPCPADGVIIGADNVLLNLNGHHIIGATGPRDGNAAGIRLTNRSRVAVVGPGEVRGFDAGVFINGGSLNRIQNLFVHDNVGTAAVDESGPTGLLGDGILVLRSSRNLIVNNVVSRNGLYDGIGVLGVGSNANTLQRNTVQDNLGSEANFSFSGHGIVLTNFFDLNDPRRGESIYDNQVLDNTVRRNFTAGVSTVSNVRGRISGNTIEDNGAPDRRNSNGIGVTRGEAALTEVRALVEGNRVRRNGQIGIAADRGASGNTFWGNEATGNVFLGIMMGAESFRNRVERNRALSNGFLDLVDISSGFEGCDANVWRDNVFQSAIPECAANGTQMSPSEATFSSSGQSDGSAYSRVVSVPAQDLPSRPNPSGSQS